MPPEPRPATGRRETRLLLITIVLSVGMLLLLARFRFPAQVESPAAPVPPPLERLAARATYDELASIMTDLERRVAPAVATIELESTSGATAFAAAPRVSSDRAVVVLGDGQRVVPGGTESSPVILSRDDSRGIAIVQLSSALTDVVTPRTATDRPGPRYVGVIQATSEGPVIRPLYVGRTDRVGDPRWPSSLVALSTPAGTVPRGAAVFALDGLFIGLSLGGGDTARLVPATLLASLARAAPGQAAVHTARGDVGVRVQALSPALSRATGASAGVVVSAVVPGGPAVGSLESGDVVQTIDGTNITTEAGFRQTIESRVPGQDVAIHAIRRGAPIDVSVKAVEAGTAAQGPAATGPGMTLRTVAGLGAEVIAVDPGGPAARAGFQQGDVLVKLNATDRPSAATVERAFSRGAAGDSWLVTVQRGVQFVVLALEKR
ncbi:MAG TPA: PDZ domain-containing protein [Vicinamibacterales bacterium]|nr:PDZ domain-containing protein [Vicinamibacterales bacterium]